MERGAGSLELGAGGRDQNKSRSPPGGRRQPEFRKDGTRANLSLKPESEWEQSGDGSPR